LRFTSIVMHQWPLTALEAFEPEIERADVRSRRSSTGTLACAKLEPSMTTKLRSNTRSGRFQPTRQSVISTATVTST
jgi:hypothetical protein